MNAILTIVSNNYLHFARTLLQSAKAQHPESALYCVIVDQDKSAAQQLAHEFEAIYLEQLNLPGKDKFLFQYTILELNTAVKPWAIEHLLNKGYESVTYIDPDIFVYQPLVHVKDLLASGADIVITPHLLAPIFDDKMPSELVIRRAGTYNFGFCSVRASDNTRRFIKWWQSKLKQDCIVDLDKGIFVDQSWIDLVPGLFDNVAILRHPGYNVAYWNLAQRKIAQQENGLWTANGEPLIFFHFSGFNPVNPDSFSKHQNRFTLSTIGAAKKLALDYAAKLIANGAKSYLKLPYHFACFSDKTPLPEVFRKTYRENNFLKTQMGEQPFEHPELMNAKVHSYAVKGLAPTYAMLSVWSARTDLQQAFSLGNYDSLKNFYHWFVEEGPIYFPEFVIQHHKHLLKKLDKLPESQNQNLPQDATPPPPASLQRVHSLFISLLGRIPDEGAVRHYSPMCETNSGYLRAWRDISLSRESKQRPHLTARMFKSFLRLFHADKSHFTYFHTTPELPPSKVNNYYEGVYVFDGDAGQFGIWASEKVTLPFNGKSNEHITLIGHYLPDLIEKQNYTTTSIIRFMLGETLLHETELTAKGDFTIEFSLADAELTADRLLEITCDKYFVPKDIGLNEDQRRLSWRLKSLAIGQTILVDCARTPVFMPLVGYYPPSGVNLVGYITAELGVGEGARNFAKAAVAAKIPYSVVDVGYQALHLQRDKSALAAAVDTRFDIDLLYVNADQTPTTLHYLNQNHLKSRISIGYWHWEQPELPIQFMRSFEGLAEIWVPSAFVQDAVAKLSPIPVFKVPHAISFAVTPGTKRAMFGLPDNRFLALVMYDFHSFQYRKNPEAAIAAFRIAAERRSDAGLIIKTINADKYPEKYAALIESVADIKNVIFLDKFFTRQEVFDLQSCCDCLISLHRAEGFGLAPAEMMFLGKPVIATGWSANMEFMTPMNSFPVEYELKKLEEDLLPYEAGSVWAEADINHAAACLKRLLDDPNLSKTIGKRASASIHEQLSPEKIGQQYKARLTLISQRFGLL